MVPPAVSAQEAEPLETFPPILRQILLNRGYRSAAAAEAFLTARPDFSSDPYQLTGMQVVIDRIRAALDRKELIAIYGDYDVDGVTATALLVQTLQELGANVKGYIPNRFDEGYGLNNEALDLLSSEGVKLVITVDCGIRSPREAEHARNIALDLIISDHHQPAEGELPQALAVINPKQPGDPYPDKNLAGVGIAFKIAEALFGSGDPALVGLLDLVALGTVADLAPLVGENRILVREGLRQIRQTKRQGLYSLASVAKIVIGKTTAGQIGYTLGPRLNAAGRLESALGAFELLMTSDPIRAGQLAQQLDVQNHQRQILTRTTQELAEALATADEREPMLLCAISEEFNPGVVGLAASRLAENHYRPAVVGARGPEETRASCRSIPEFNITEALDQCADLLVRHGGHAAAAGFTVRNENLMELLKRLKTIAKTELAGKDLRPSIAADLEVELSDLDFDLLKELAQLEPTGFGNPTAMFVTINAKVGSSRTVGTDGRHLKMVLQDELGTSMDAIGFNLGNLKMDLPGRVDVIYTLESNEYNGRTTLQLNLKDVKPGGMSV